MVDNSDLWARNIKQEWLHPRCIRCFNYYFEKLQIYIDWLEQDVSFELLNEYAENFSLLVKQKVIDSEWVVGVLDYLKNNYKRQQFFLVTATPQKEIEDIISSLKIKNLFKEIIGSPTKKRDALQKIMVDFQV